jgi:hypothetical protein
MDLQYQAEKLGSSAKDFLSSNSLVSHIVFVILVIIGFILLLRLGTAILSYIFSPRPNVSLINGMINGTKQMQISSNPQVRGSIPILRSVDQYRGIEFTWSTWIFIDGNNLGHNKDRFRHIFSKGNNNMGVDGIMEPLNGPGLYISPNNNPNVAELSLLLRMNVFTDENYGHNLSQVNNACLQAIMAEKENPSTNPSNPAASLTECQAEFPYLNNSSLQQNVVSQALAPAIFDDIEVPEIPINKWVSVIIRCENNNIIDIYINGRLVRRHRLSGIARQNYGDVNIAFGGGFGGFISELRYFNYAIGTSEIDSIVSNGPNLTTSDATDLGTAKPYYLANRWFNDEMDPVYSVGVN